MFRRITMMSLVICAICVLAFGCATADLVKWDFEDGTLQGWTVVSGDVGKQPVDADDDRWGGNFNKQGRYFIGTYENMHDAAQGELRSPDFTITANLMSLLVGGGSHAGTYIAMYDSDGEELFRETGFNSELMSRRIWYVSPYKGKTVYLKIVDRESGGWGHINVDDIRQLSADEEAEIEADRKRLEAAIEQWKANLELPGRRIVHSVEGKTDLAMPLGGIGAGNIAVCGDGALREWQIFNKVNAACLVPGHFFAIWARAGDSDPVARILGPSIEGLPGIERTEFIGEFPIAEVRYKDADLPVEVRMEAFSPFIPANAAESGIPGIYFVFKVKNPGRTQVSVSLAASLQNAVNYDGRSPIDGVRFKDYGGNLNSVIQDGGFTAIHMSNPDLSPEERQFGTMILAAMGSNVTSIPQWDIPITVWSDFARDGKLDSQSSDAPSRKGRTWNGALANSLGLRPGEEKSVVFFITWHFPNHYAEYDRNLAEYRIGRNYNNRFKDSAQVAKYMAENYGKLAHRTRLFRDTLYDSTLPYWLLDRIGAPASTLTSQTCLWIEDGTFHAFEGSGSHGCCPMNCTHVWNYEQTLAYLFPEIERLMRHTDLLVQQTETGSVHHRTVLPLNLPRSSGPFIDGHLGTILKSYREHLLSADDDWLAEMWPNIKMAMDFAIREWDPNEDGVLVNQQWNTYDAAMFGPNTFIGTLYLAALRATEEMAAVMKDPDAQRYRRLFESGSKRLDDVLWNGEYYIHIDRRDKAERAENGAWMLEDWPDEASLAEHQNRPYGIGCHADQLLGQWWAHILGLGYLLPEERVGKALDSMLRYNWRWDFGEVVQQRAFAGPGDMGLLCCTWPHGERPSPAILYADEVWTGIEYAVAGLMLYEGMESEANQIARAVLDRYNGIPRPPIKRSPWNEIECGEHYVRAMSSWSMLLAAQGFSYNGPNGSMAFNPRISPENHRSLFTCAEGWGTFSQKQTRTSHVNTIELKYGRLRLNSLTINLPEEAEPKSLIAALGRKSLNFEGLASGKTLTLKFAEPLQMNAGERLSVEIEW